jgi:hypothetical protein
MTSAPLTAGIPTIDPFQPSEESNPLLQELQRPAVEEEQQDQRTQAEWLNTTRQKLDDSLLDPEKLDFDFSKTSNPEQARQRALVRGYILLENQGQPIPGGDLGFQLQRSKIAKERFNGKGHDDDLAFFSEIQKEAQQKKANRNFEEEIQTRAITSATIAAIEGKDKASTFPQLLAEARTKPDYQPGNDFRYLEIWNETQSAVKQSFADGGEPLKEIWEAMKKGPQGNASQIAGAVIKDAFLGFEGETIEQWNAKDAPRLALDHYYKLTEEERPDFIASLSLLARNLPKDQQAAFFRNLTTQSGRDIDDMARNIASIPGSPENVRGLGDFIGGRNTNLPTQASLAQLTEKQEQILAARNFASEIRNIERQDYNPIKKLAKGKTMQAFEGGLYAAPGALATTAMMAVPYVGPALTISSMQGSAYDDMRRRLIAGGMDDKTASKFAADTSLAVAGLQFIPERIGFSAITRNSPILNKVFTKISDRVTNRLARFAATSAAVGAIETGTELAEALVPALWIEAASATNEEIPGTDWEAEFKDYGYHTLETFVATLPLALFGGAGGINQDARNEAFAQADPLARLAYGITPEDNAAIEAAKQQGPSSLNAAIETALENKDPGSESSIEAVQQIAEATVKAKELAAQAEAAGLFPTIVHNSETNTFTLYDQQTNEEIGQAKTADEAVKLAATHTASIDLEHADRVAFVSSILQAQQQSGNFQTRGAGELEGRTIISEARLGETLTAAQAAVGNPAALARIAAQTRLREQTEGGDGTITDVVFGQSITDPASLARRQRTTVNRIQQGATILTVFHEETHGFWREAQAKGRLSQDEAITFLKGLDTLGTSNAARGKAYKTLLPADFDTLPAEDKAVAVDEAISEWMEAEILRSRKGTGSRYLPPGLVTKNLSALARIVGDKNVGKFRSFIRAIREYFGIALNRAFIIQQALAKGDLKKEDYTAFVDKLHGLTEQTDFEAMVQQADTELTQEFDEQAYIDEEFPDGNPFSLGRVTLPPTTQKSGEVSPTAQVDSSLDDSFRLRNSVSIRSPKGEISPKASLRTSESSNLFKSAPTEAGDEQQISFSIGRARENYENAKNKVIYAKKELSEVETKTADARDSWEKTHGISITVGSEKSFLQWVPADAEIPRNEVAIWPITKWLDNHNAPLRGGWVFDKKNREDALGFSKSTDDKSLAQRAIDENGNIRAVVGDFDYLPFPEPTELIASREYLAKAQADLYLAELEFDPETEPRLADAENIRQRELSKKASAFAALLDARDLEARNAAQTFITKLWNTYAQFDEIFQYGKTTSKKAENIAEAVSTPGRTITAVDAGDTIVFKSKNGFVTINQANTTRPYISASNADSKGKKQGGGSQLYAAALDWIHNNNKRIKDDSGLTGINYVRRTSNFFASAIRWGTTKHLKPHEKQTVGKWTKNDILNTSLLATKEMANIHKAIPESKGWAFGFETGIFKDVDGNEISTEALENAVLAAVPDTSGIGLSTLQRAIITSSAIQEFQRGSSQTIIQTAESSLPDALRGVSYSLGRQVSPIDYKPTAQTVIATTNVSSLTSALLGKDEQLVPLDPESSKPMMVSPAYRAAKKGGDKAAAWRIALEFTSGKRLEVFKAALDGKKPVFVPVTQAEGKMVNMLPLAFAHALSKRIGGRVEREILQQKQGGNTGVTQDERSTKEHDFTGNIQLAADETLVLLDDTFTSGSTLTALYDHLAKDNFQADYIFSIASGRYTKDIAAPPARVQKALDKIGLTEEEFEREFATKINSFTGAELQAYILNGAAGVDGFRKRFIGGTSQQGPSLLRGSRDFYSIGIDKSKINSYFSESHEGEKLTEATDKTLDLFSWGSASASDGGRSASLQRQAAQTSPASDSSRDGELIAELIRQASNPSIPSNPRLPQQIQEAIDKKQGKPLSIILSEMIERKIPNWNPIGQKAESEEDIFALNAVFRNPWFESLRVMAVDRNFKVIAAEVQTVGTLSETPVDQVGMLNFILRAQEIDPEAKLIFSHNHPSGNPNPSRADMRITDSLKEIAKEIGVTILDHVITNGTKGFSFSSQSQFTVSKEMDVNWTSIDRTSLPALDNPDISQNLGFALRAANNSATWIAYVDAQLQIRALNILPSDKKEAARTIIKDAGLVGAAGIVTFKPDFNKETKSLMNFFNELAGKLNLRYIDSIFQDSFDPSNSFSAKAAGMMEDSSPYSIGQSKIADLLRDDATARIRNPEVRAKALSKIARGMEEIRLAAEKLELQIGNKRLSKSLQREAAVRQAMRFEELENQALARHSGILSDDDLTILSAQPLHSMLIREVKSTYTRKDGKKITVTKKQGRLMSRTQAAKRHPDMFSRDKAGEYDGSEGMPSIIYGGQNMPDQIADEFFRAGLIADAYPDTLWEALRREQNSVDSMKTALENAKADLKAARTTSQAEAKAWLDAQIGNQELNFSPKEEILRASAMLDAILTALPAQLRGQIGGYTPLARLGSDETRLAFLRDRLATADRLLERHLRKEFDKQFRQLLERARPEKDDAGKRPKGKIGADVHELFQDIRDAMLLNGPETEAMVASLDILAGDPDITPEQSAHLTLQSNLVSLVGNWRNAGADRMESALIEAERIYARGYSEQVTKNLRKAEHYRDSRHELKASTGMSGDRMERVNKAIEEAKAKNLPSQAFKSLLSFQQVVETAFGPDSKIAKRLIDWERRASNAKHDATFNAQVLIEKLFADLAGGKLKGEKLRWEMSQPKAITVKDGFGKEHTFSELTALTATMMWRQEDGRRHMEGPRDENGKPTGDWQWTDEAMDNIEKQLSDNAKAIRLHLTERYASEYDRLNAIYVDLYGVSLPRHKLYSPISVKPAQAMGGQGVDPVTGFSTSSNALSPGSLKTRSQSAIAEPDLERDALSQYIAHTAQMEHWMAYAPFATEAQALINNREVGNAIEAAGGKETLNILRGWMDFFAQGGSRDAAAHLAGVKFIGRALSRASQVALFGRISTLAIQSTQLLAAASQMPTGAFLTRFAKLMTGNLSWKAALKSDFIRRRLEQQPPIVRQAMENMMNDKPSVIKYGSRKMGETIAGADALFTSGTYAIIYDYQLKLNNGNEALAHAETERLTEQIAQPTRPGTRSLYENLQTNPILKLGWAFASEPRQKLGYFAFSFSKHKTAKDRARAFFLVWGAGGVFASLIRAVMADMRDDEDDEWFDEKNWDPKRLALMSLTGPLGGIPIIGDSAEGALFKLFGEYIPQGNLFSSAEKALASTKNIDDWFTGDRDFMDAVKDVESILSGAGLVSGNAASLATFMHLIRDLLSMADNALPD